MTERLNGFVSVRTPKQYADLGCTRIAHILRKPLAVVDPNEVLDLAHAQIALKKGDLPEIGIHELRRLNEKYRPPNGVDKRTAEEISQIFFQASELIDGRSATSNSYGLYAPSYENALLSQKESWDESQEYRSLLVGALTSETAMEYTATVKNIFPQAKTHIIDIEGRETISAPGFIFGSGMELPFPNASFGSIHTNYLLNMIEGGDETDIQKIEQLLQESSRVLTKKGMLIMCEGKLNAVLKSNFAIGKKWELAHLLKRYGFEQISIKKGLKFENRQAMMGHFHSSHGEDNRNVVADKKTFYITAVKS